MHRSLLASPLAVALVAALAPVAAAEPPQLHVETDPLPLIQGGYGLQAGVRPAGTPWRIAVASFSLDVPDPAVQVGGNDGFHLRVRPSAALYVLRYFPGGTAGWSAVRCATCGCATPTTTRPARTATSAPSPPR